MSVRDTTVAGKVLDTTEIRNLYVHIITLTPITSKENTAVDCRPFMQITRSDAETKV